MSQLEQNTTTIQSLINKANALPDVGSGGSSGIQYEIITIPGNLEIEDGYSIDYTLPRVTAAYGSIRSNIYHIEGIGRNPFLAISIENNDINMISEFYLNGATDIEDATMSIECVGIKYSNNKMVFETWGDTLWTHCDIKVILINDPNAEAISV